MGRFGSTQDPREEIYSYMIFGTRLGSLLNRGAWLTQLLISLLRPSFQFPPKVAAKFATVDMKHGKGRKWVSHHASK
jgi:hypothetical protein